MLLLPERPTIPGWGVDEAGTHHDIGAVPRPVGFPGRRVTEVVWKRWRLGLAVLDHPLRRFFRGIVCDRGWVRIDEHQLGGVGRVLRIEVRGAVQEAGEGAALEVAYASGATGVSL